MAKEKQPPADLMRAGSAIEFSLFLHKKSDWVVSSCEIHERGDVTMLLERQDERSVLVTIVGSK